MFSFATNLSRLLTAKGLTQKELASSIGTTEATISRYINGERGPNAVLVAKMARVLNTTSDYLLGNTDDPSSLDKLTDMVEDAKKENSSSKYTKSRSSRHLYSDNISSGLHFNEEQRPMDGGKNKAGQQRPNIIDIIRRDPHKRSICNKLLDLSDADIEKVETFINYLCSLQLKEK